MTQENCNKVVHTERHSGPEQARHILEWLSREQLEDADVFAKVGDHGSKFTYCHLAIGWCPNKSAVDAQVRREGWTYLGTVGEAAAGAGEVLASLFNGHAGQPYKWRTHQKTIIFEDSHEIDYVASAPVELWENVEKYRREIVQLLGNDWDLLANIGCCYVHFAHIQILPYQARQAGELNAAGPTPI